MHVWTRLSEQLLTLLARYRSRSLNFHRFPSRRPWKTLRNGLQFLVTLASTNPSMPLQTNSLRMFTKAFRTAALKNRASCSTRGPNKNLLWPSHRACQLSHQSIHKAGKTVTAKSESQGRDHRKKWTKLTYAGSSKQSARIWPEPGKLRWWRAYTLSFNTAREKS